MQSPTSRMSASHPSGRTWPNKAAKETSSRTPPTRVTSRTVSHAQQASEYGTHRRAGRRARKPQASGTISAASRSSLRNQERSAFEGVGRRRRTRFASHPQSEAERRPLNGGIHARPEDPRTATANSREKTGPDGSAPRAASNLTRGTPSERTPQRIFGQPPRHEPGKRSQQ